MTNSNLLEMQKALEESMAKMRASKAENTAKDDFPVLKKTYKSRGNKL